MNSVAAVTLLAIELACTGAAAAADFTGTWAFHATVGEPALIDSKPVCTLKQNGGAIVGTCKAPNAVGSSAGVVRGNTISLTWHHAKTSSVGLNGIARFHGVLGTDGVIRGSAADSVFPDIPGAFSARKIR